MTLKEALSLRVYDNNNIYYPKLEDVKNLPDDAFDGFEIYEIMSEGVVKIHAYIYIEEGCEFEEYSDCYIYPNEIYGKSTNELGNIIQDREDNSYKTIHNIQNNKLAKRFVYYLEDENFKGYLEYDKITPNTKPGIYCSHFMQTESPY